MRFASIAFTLFCVFPASAFRASKDELFKHNLTQSIRPKRSRTDRTNAVDRSDTYRGNLDATRDADSGRSESGASRWGIFGVQQLSCSKLSSFKCRQRDDCRMNGAGCERKKTQKCLFELESGDYGVIPKLKVTYKNASGGDEREVGEGSYHLYVYVPCTATDIQVTFSETAGSWTAAVDRSDESKPWILGPRGLKLREVFKYEVAPRKALYVMKGIWFKSYIASVEVESQDGKPLTTARRITTTQSLLDQPDTNGDAGRGATTSRQPPEAKEQVQDKVRPDNGAWHTFGRAWSIGLVALLSWQISVIECW